MKKIPVQKTLSVSVDKKSHLIVVRIGFQNVSDSDVWVLRPPPNLFLSSEGEDVDYVGRTDKRSAYTLADYEKVPPGGKVERVVEISKLYDFKPGNHHYVVSLPGGYKDPETGERWEAPTVKAGFDFAR